MRLQLLAIDTWFFRDGTPFDMDGSSQSGVVGMFPPAPPTVAGAIRAALARRNGWDGRGRWTGGELAAILGDGPEDLGRLRVAGPFVLRDGAPVFPMPLHVAGRVAQGGDWSPVALLRPGRMGVMSDLGAGMRLPEAGSDIGDGDARSLEGGAGRWVTLEGLRRILRGELPRAEEIVSERALWVGEGRIGIARAPESRNVADGAIYSTRHARPTAGVSLGVEVEGMPADWAWPTGDLIPFGGESRLAACEAWDDGQPKIAFDGPARDAATAVIVALTPVLLGGPGSELAISGARIVSACTERPLRIGGWDSRARAPLRLRNAAPPGSVWFCELEDPDVFRKTIATGLMHIGDAAAMGFGLCAVGTAPPWETTI
jgi:CRISPR-associated protein Cmr3